MLQSLVEFLKDTGNNRALNPLSQRDVGHLVNIVTCRQRGDPIFYLGGRSRLRVLALLLERERRRKKKHVCNELADNDCVSSGVLDTAVVGGNEEGEGSEVDRDP